MNRGELDDTLPLPLAGGLVPEHERERAVPIADGPSLAGIRIARVLAVHVDLLSVYGVVGQHDVLQGRLCEHACRGRQQRRSAVVVRVAAACAGLVLHGMLSEGHVAVGIVARVRNDIGIRLGNVGRCCPHFDGVLACRLDHLRELLGGGGGRLRRAAGADADAPSTDPADAREREVRPRRDCARVIGRAAAARLELVLRDEVGLVAAGARGGRPLLEGERSGEHERRIDVRYRNLVRIGGDRGQHCRGTSRAVGRAAGGRRPAVVELITEPDDEARLARGIEIDLQLGREIGLGRIGAREVRCL